MPDAFTALEQEILVLKSVWDSIGDMANYAMFNKLGEGMDSQIQFRTERHQRLFNVLLVDLLSQPQKWPFDLPSPPPGSAQSERSIFYHLRRIAENPQLNKQGPDALREPLDAFAQWLEGECRIEKVWFPSIQLETDIAVRRVAFIKICGDIGKHSFTRLSRNVAAICRILADNGHAIDPNMGYLVLPEFYDWFHDNVFSYHSSAIAEFLNNLRWGIYEYLRPEFQRSFMRDEPQSIEYQFQYPEGCNQEPARTLYWDLMNAVRRPPYMPRFTVTRYLKMRY